jgi:5-oxoprolinase (ATP-hydrolysing) subunit A
MRVNLNADLGESFGAWKMGSDEALMPLINSANIACGMHAGDPATMAQTVDTACRFGVSIGAHPSFQDLIGFGRRPIQMQPRDIELLVLYQIGALQAIASARGSRVTHVKPHGALNNMAHDDDAIARAIAKGIRLADPNLIFVANIGSAMVLAGRQSGLTVALEAYADRRYDANARLLSRQRADSVIDDADEAAESVVRMVESQAIFSVDGQRIASPIHSICVHGDSAHAITIARTVRTALEKRQIDLVTLPQLHLEGGDSP